VAGGNFELDHHDAEHHRHCAICEKVCRVCVQTCRALLDAEAFEELQKLQAPRCRPEQVGQPWAALLIALAIGAR